MAIIGESLYIMGYDRRKILINGPRWEKFPHYWAVKEECCVLSFMVDLSYTGHDGEHGREERTPKDKSGSLLNPDKIGLSSKP